MRNLQRSAVFILAAGMSLATTTVPHKVRNSPAPLNRIDTNKHALNFEPNRGQTDSRVRYVGRGKQSTVYITDQGAVLASTQMPDPQSLRTKTGAYDPSKLVTHVQAIHMNLVGASKPTVPQATEPLASTSSYYIGSDRSKWLSNVPHFGRVEAKNVYSGVDIVYYGNEGKLEYDFIVSPGADTNQIQLAFTGQKSLEVASNGDLIFGTTNGSFVQRKPLVYQQIGKQRVTVASHYKIQGAKVGFELAKYDASRPLVIDPTLETGSYLGGTGTDVVNSMDGNYIAGFTSSLNFPTAGNTTMNSGGADAFIASIDPLTGTPSASAYFGGSGFDVATGVSQSTVDRYTSYVCAGGFTSSPNFPITANPALSSYDAGFVGFVTCFSDDVRTGSQGINSPPVASSYVGNKGTLVNAVSFKSDKPTELLIAGQGLRGSIFGSPQVNYNGGTQCWSNYSCYNSHTDLDAFAGTFRVDYVGPTQLSQIEAGGTGDDTFNSISGSSQGFVAVGTTQSSDALLIHPIKSSLGGSNQNAFLFIYEYNSGSSFSGSPDITYFGGNNGGDAATSVKATVSASGADFTVGGYTSATTWPNSVNPLQGNSTNAGGYDSFAAQFSTNFTSGHTTTIGYNTIFGGNGDDLVNAIDVHTGPDSFPQIYLGGQTQSNNLLSAIGGTSPLAGQSALKGTSDAFLVVLKPANGLLKAATYLGGSSTDSINALTAIGYKGNNVYVAGSTGNAGDFPTGAPNSSSKTPFQANYNGGSSDGFFANIFLPSDTPVSLTANNAGTSNSLSQPIPFTVDAPNCTVPAVARTYWTATCALTPALATLNFTFPAQVTSNGVKYTFVSGPDGTSNLTSTVTVQNFSDRTDFTVNYATAVQLNITTAGTGSGTTAPASGGYQQPYVSIPISATPAAGSVFSGWTLTSDPLNARIADPASASTTITLGAGAGVSIVANFALTAKTNPVITWNPPTSMTFGGALGSAQLNATSNVPGVFVYNPPAGTVLTAGTGRALRLTFTPTDTASYNTVTAQRSIDVVTVPGGLVITRTLARATGGNVTVTYSVANTSSAAANNVTVTNASFGSVSGTPLPQSLGSIPAGGVTSGVFTVTGNAGVSGALTISGSYSGGTFSSTARVTLP